MSDVFVCEPGAHVFERGTGRAPERCSLCSMSAADAYAALASSRGGRTDPGDDPSDGISIFNFCGVTAKDQRVVIMMPPRSGTLDPEDALRYAAWLIAGAELAGHARPLEVTNALVRRILST